MELTLYSLVAWILSGLVLGWIFGGSARLGGPEDQ